MASGGQRPSKMDIQFLMNDSPRRRSSSGKARSQAMGQTESETLVRTSSHHSHRASTTWRKGPCFPCDACGKTFSLRGNLNKHIKTVHLDERKHFCQYCGTKFHFSDGLKRHILLIHSGKHQYLCRLCNATFTQRSHLAKHENKTHFKN